MHWHDVAGCSEPAFQATESLIVAAAWHEEESQVHIWIAIQNGGRDAIQLGVLSWTAAILPWQEAAPQEFNISANRYGNRQVQPTSFAHGSLHSSWDGAANIPPGHTCLVLPDVGIWQWNQTIGERPDRVLVATEILRGGGDPLRGSVVVQLASSDLADPPPTCL